MWYSVLAVQATKRGTGDPEVLDVAEGVRTRCPLWASVHSVEYEVRPSAEGRVEVEEVGAEKRRNEGMIWRLNFLREMGGLPGIIKCPFEVCRAELKAQSFGRSARFFLQQYLAC